MVIFSGNTWRRNVGLWVEYALLPDFNKRTINVTQQSKIISVLLVLPFDTILHYIPYCF